MIDVEAKIKELEPRLMEICRERNLDANERELIITVFKASLHIAFGVLLTSLWHDASEEPKRYDTYLVKTVQGCVDMCFFDAKGWNEPKIGGGNVAMWLDLKDILPNEEGGEQ